MLGHGFIVTSKLMNWETKLQDWCNSTGASHAGATPLTTPKTWPHYESWLKAGHHGSLSYLENHAPAKKDPQSWIPKAKSALVFAFPYQPHPEGPSPFSKARVALYAQGRDYHHWIKERLQSVIQELQVAFPEHFFETQTDSSPLLERDLAERAGLGWFGKNTCLIHPQKGSLFLIAEIVTSLQIESSVAPLPDFCGTCQRCLDVCPTQALREPRVLKADLCISYWTIESREVAPEHLRSRFGDWLFGCDLCQTVCPWNQKVFKGQGLRVEPQLPLSSHERQALIEELRPLLVESHNQIQRRLRGTALARAGAKGLKRNALVVIGNQKLGELRAEVESLRQDPYFAQLADWSLQKLELLTRPKVI